MVWRCGADDCRAKVTIAHVVEWDPPRKPTASLHMKIRKAKQFAICDNVDVSRRKPPETINFDAVWTKLHRGKPQNESPKQHHHSGLDQIRPREAEKHTKMNSHQCVNKDGNHHEHEERDLQAGRQSKRCGVVVLCVSHVGSPGTLSR